MLLLVFFVSFVFVRTIVFFVPLVFGSVTDFGLLVLFGPSAFGFMVFEPLEDFGLFVFAFFLSNRSFFLTFLPLEFVILALYCLMYEA